MSIQYLRITVNGVAYHVPLDVPEGCSEKVSPEGQRERQLDRDMEARRQWQIGTYGAKVEWSKRLALASIREGADVVPYRFRRSVNRVAVCRMYLTMNFDTALDRVVRALYPYGSAGPVDVDEETPEAIIYRRAQA